MTLQVEGIADSGVRGEKALSGSCRLELPKLSVSPPKGQM